MCLKPIKVNYSDRYKNYRGQLIHAYNKGQVLPCGKCVECVELKIEEWEIRWSEQLKTSIENSSYLLTLTYSDENIPTLITEHGEEKSTLDYTDVQKFFKRLRKRQNTYCIKNNLQNPKIYYHGCGEYGTQYTKRPHYHILITNLIIPKQEIQKIWGNGLVHIGEDVTPKTIKYVLKYTLKNSYENHTKNKTKIYQKLIKEVLFTPFKSDIDKKLFEKFGIKPFEFNIQKSFEQKQKLIATIYKPKHKNEYRVVEKSFCSKGIGKNFITEDNVKLYRENPKLNYLYFDTKTEQYKQKPLPRYYKEIIFNPKKRDINGKIIRDDRGYPISLWSPLSPDYENTPRFKKQLLTFQAQQQQFNKTLFFIENLGYEQYIKSIRANRENQLYLKTLRNNQKIAQQNHKNKIQGIAQLI